MTDLRLTCFYTFFYPLGENTRGLNNMERSLNISRIYRIYHKICLKLSCPSKISVISLDLLEVNFTGSIKNGCRIFDVTRRVVLKLKICVSDRDLQRR